MISTGALGAGACSDDEGSSSPAAPGGEGGEPAAGGQAGKPNTGGSTTLGGAGGDSGAGGFPGMPPMPSEGEQCAACGATECKDELDSCTANPECAPWLACITECDDEACTSACDATHADVSRVYYGVYACLCDSCEDDCTVAKSCDKDCVPDDALPSTTTIPPTLAETGLYVGGEGGANGEGGADGMGGAGGAGFVSSGTSMELAPYVRGFEPKYPLWADGLTKDRYVYIPKCSTIDTSDPDHWRFPVGTRFWKQFTSSDNAGGTRVETRMLHHYGPGQADWLYAAYQWDDSAPDDPSAAVSVPEGFTAVGAGHDIPSQAQCQACHNGLAEKVLGFGAFQLSHDSDGADLTIEKISNLGWLSEPAPDGFLVPGTPVQQAALGYLHGNCGGCHFQGAGVGGPTPLVLRLAAAQDTYAGTDTVTSAVGIPVFSGNVAIAGKDRIEPMDAANSAILIRMIARGSSTQMPPLSTGSTKLPDTDGGVADVTAWVNSIQ